MVDVGDDADVAQLAHKGGAYIDLFGKIYNSIDNL
jgi:hypothetical protein